MNSDKAIKIIKENSPLLWNKLLAMITKKMDHISMTPKDPVKIGFVVILVFFGIFGLWSVLAPIKSAAVTQGSIVLNANRKIIQHLEGGIIQSIPVKEGAVVKRDDVLMVLRKTKASSNLNLLYNQLRVNIAAETRLLSQQQNKIILTLDDPLLNDRTNPEVNEIITIQQKLFESYVQTVHYRMDILSKQIQQIQEQIAGLHAQKEAVEEQIVLLQQEEDIVKQLVAAGHETQPRLFSLQRTRIELKGKQGSFVSQIAKARQSIHQIKLEMLDFKNEKQKEIATELNDVQSKINDLRAQQVSSEDVLDRLIIKAPYSGIVTDMKFHSIGGVVSPHQEIMTIIPQDDELIIETRLNPQDIDVVHAGLEARIRLLAYKARHTPMLTGEVIHVSPDQLLDPVTQATYYLVRVKVTNNNPADERAASLNNELKLYPGMPAEVLIVTGRRTFLAYMLEPIQKTLNRSFRED